MNLEHDLDSLTKLTITPKLNYKTSSGEYYTENNFATTEGLVSRETKNTNATNSSNYTASSGIRVTRDFKKKDRFLNLYYYIDKGANEGSGQLSSTNLFYTDTIVGLNDIDQKKQTNSNNITHQASVSFLEPFTKKIKGEATYEFIYNDNNQSKESLNKVNNDYSLLDSIFSNDFSNSKMVNQAKLRLIYEIKKYRLVIGTRARQVSLTNTNNYNDSVLKLSVNNVLPFINYNYNFSQNMRLYLTYNTNSQQPSINQLQPLRNNANQNFITLGNPNLIPTFQHQFNLNFNSYKPISGKYMWLGGNYNITQNAFSSSLVYDSIGRSISTATNMNGNYNGAAWIGANWPTLKRQLIFSVNGNSNFSSNNNIINNVVNTTRNSNINGSTDITVDLEKFYFNIGGRYEYNIPYSTINNQNNKPYTSQIYNASVRIELKKKFFIESDAEYTIKSKRANGYNIEYAIVNAAISKHFGKLENFIVAIKAFDILNQNIVANRQVYNNIITDSRTKIITRYFLLNLTYKFNSQKTKDEGKR
ncbi:MAG: TonB-dependent receptor [Sphingobacteriaceae bacterium]|nr:TonB-dependent receptor [Sphingobacteriaceae bacterium]